MTGPQMAACRPAYRSLSTRIPVAMARNPARTSLVVSAASLQWLRDASPADPVGGADIIGAMLIIALAVIRVRREDLSGGRGAGHRPASSSAHPLASDSSDESDAGSRRGRACSRDGRRVAVSACPVPRLVYDR